MFLDNKYTKWYFQLLNFRRITPFTDYGEWHHEIPKSLGGTNDKSNLVRLTAREHFVAHRLLTKMTVGDNNRKMWYALKRTVSSGNVTITSRTFAKIREEYAQAVSQTLTGRKLSAEHRENIGKHWKGKPKSESFKKQLSDRLNDEQRDADRRAKISASLKGHKMSEETRRKISETRKKKHAEGTLRTRWSE